MRQRNKRKLTAGLLSAAGAAVLALSLLTAGASAAPNPGPGDGPQSANVPYVAWVGEHVRLVVCDPVINTTGQFANYAVEDWSGYQFQPPTPDGDSGNNIGQVFDPGPAAFFQSSEPAHSTESGQDGCVATDYKSLNPGLSRIRVTIRNQEGNAIVFSHQFLVIWLTANQPTLSEAGLESKGSETFQSQLSGSGHGALEKFLGDSAGDGKFIPSPFDPSTAPNEDKGLIQIRVTGSFPVVAESPLSNILTSSSYTLPNDWVTLADTLASSSEETASPGSNPSLWDIHGTPSEEPTNTNASWNEGPLSAPFWRPAFHNYTSGATATVGPYDPQAANETLLSDNRLNVDDAPMPALRVDVSIAKNEGGEDLGGVGQISGASKAQIYSHNFDGNAEAEGNLYNPFYGAYIPATDRPGVNEVSGIDGPSPGGDFPGFLNNHSKPYTFWESVHSENYREASSTECLRRRDGQPSYYQTPSGPLTETFYTDERGEAYVTYTPGDGFYLNHIPTITTDANGGCDLESLYEKEIGHSTITAKAVYPYEPVDFPPVTSESLTKTVTSKWLKEVYEFPKGTTSGDQNVRIIVAKAQDIDGQPFVGETVCFHAQQESSVQSFTGSVVDTNNQLGLGKGATVDLGGTEVVSPPAGSIGLFCETTNSEGLAGIEMQNSTYPHVDVTTLFVNEEITRDNEFDFSTNSGTTREAEEKKAHEEAEAKAHEEAEKKRLEAEKKVHEEEAEAEEKRHKAEAEAEKTRNEEEATAEKKRHEEEAAAEKKRHEEEIAAKTTAEEQAAARKKAEAEEAAATEKRKHEEEAAAEKRKHEEEAAAEKRKHEEEEASARRKHEEEAGYKLVTPVPGGLTGVKASVAHKASTKHKGKKGKKSSKKSKKGKK